MKELRSGSQVVFCLIIVFFVQFLLMLIFGDVEEARGPVSFPVFGVASCVVAFLLFFVLCALHGFTHFVTVRTLDLFLILTQGLLVLLALTEIILWVLVCVHQSLDFLFGTWEGWDFLLSLPVLGCCVVLESGLLVRAYRAVVQEFHLLEYDSIGG